MTRRFVAICAIAILGACSSSGTSPVVTAITGAILPPKQEEIPASGPSVTLTRDMIETNGLAMFQGRLEGEEASNILSATSLNGHYVTYLSAFRQTVTLLGGLVTATRGIGRDLLSVRSAPNDPVAVLTPPENWPTSISRDYRFPGNGPEGNLITVNCTLSNNGKTKITIIEVTYDVTEFSETCSGEGVEFTNIYMADSKTGQIWRAKQWIGTREEYLNMDILEPFTLD